jgi:glucosamine--fructose-6-phosphate aminotransferase (isomerizing)
MKRIGYRLAVSRQAESLEDGRQAAAAALDTLDLSGFASGVVGFAGMGASYQAALAGALYLRQFGRKGFAFTPTELYGTHAAADCFIALSASGQSREIADVMREAAGYPRLAICRGASNPLTEITGAALATASGADNGASSTGYTGTLLTLGMLVERIAAVSAFDWTALVQAAQTVLDGSAAAAGRAARLLQGRTSIDIVGAGIGFANAGEAAMLIREAVRIPASGWDTLNYLHGPMESQDAATGLVAFGEGREVKIAQDVAGFGCPSVLITHRTDIAGSDMLAVISVPSVDNAMADGILKIIALQMIVGDMQDANGLTDITFRYRQTDTKLKPWSPTEL